MNTQSQREHPVPMKELIVTEFDILSPVSCSGDLSEGVSGDLSGGVGVPGGVPGGVSGSVLVGVPEGVPEDLSGSVLAGVPEDATVFDLSNKNLHQCIGCWTCWLKTPGRCIFNDLDEFYMRYLSADRVTFYLRISQGFVTSNMKALIDRMIPFVLPTISWETGESLHEPRYTRYPEVDVFYQGEFLPGEEDAFVAYWKRTLSMMFAPRFSVQYYSQVRETESLSHYACQGETASSSSKPPLILNGSPNGKKGNTEIFVRQFIEGFEEAPDILCIAEEDPAELATRMSEYESWLFFFPMYVNAMPGIVKRLFEHMQPDGEKKVGFFVQYGFEEGAQSDYLVRLLESFMVRMGYQSLGIVVSGGNAGVRFMPANANKKLFGRLKAAGARFEQAGRFDDETAKSFERMRAYSPLQIRLNMLFRKLGLTNIFWNHMLKQNNAFERRLDRPFGT